MRNNNGFFEIYNRETGIRRPRRFARQFSASQELIKKLDSYAELKGHNDRISSMEFNSSGDLLVSGSHDKQVIFWNWEAKTKSLSYDPGHLNMVYQTKIMPLTNDRRIVTACAGGQVMLGEVLEDGQVHTRRLGISHRFAVHKLAVEPGNPNVIYSCGEDSFVQHFDLRSNCATMLFNCKSLIRGELHPGKAQLYQMVFDPTNPNNFCLGGNDAYARIYDLRKCWQDANSGSLVEPVNTFRPAHLIHSRYYMITGLAYSNSGELLVSYWDDLIYLFQKNMGLGPPPALFLVEYMNCQLGKPEQYVGHRNATAGRVSFLGPNDEYVLSGSHCGHIFIWKKNGGELIRVITGDSLHVHEIQRHPHIPIIATSGSENNIKLWAPIANDDASPLPDDVTEIMEGNRQSRSDTYSQFFTDYNLTE